MSIEEEIEMLEGEFCELKHEEQSEDVTHRMQELTKKCKQEFIIASLKRRLA